MMTCIVYYCACGVGRKLCGVCCICILCYMRCIVCVVLYVVLRYM